VSVRVGWRPALLSCLVLESMIELRIEILQLAIPTSLPAIRRRVKSRGESREQLTTLGQESRAKAIRTLDRIQPPLLFSRSLRIAPFNITSIHSLSASTFKSVSRAEQRGGERREGEQSTCYHLSLFVVFPEKSQECGLLSSLKLNINS